MITINLNAFRLANGAREDADDDRNGFGGVVSFRHRLPADSPALHFLSMMPSPRTEEIACYFYNPVEKDVVRGVSYHFEKDSDMISPDPSVLTLIRQVEQNGKG